MTPTAPTPTTPGVVLDPFAGSGTTAEAAVIEGFDNEQMPGQLALDLEAS